MASNLAIYVHDHLAGAKFAVELLGQLVEHASDEGAQLVAREVLDEVEQDRQLLLEFAERIGEAASAGKQALGWLAEKLSRAKLAPDDALGSFEAVEWLCLGILGKRALWAALESLQGDDGRLRGLDFPSLIDRAEKQHDRMESLRLSLGMSALRGPGEAAGSH